MTLANRLYNALAATIIYAGIAIFCLALFLGPVLLIMFIIWLITML